MPDSFLKRLVAFLRSVIPADPWQLVYLVGTVFLLIWGGLSWRGGELGPFSSDYLPFIVLCSYVSLATAFVALFTSFWPGRRPALRIAVAVILPTVALIVLIVWKTFRITEAQSTVFHSQVAAHFYSWLPANIWKFPTAPYFAVFGLVLISVYTTRLVAGAASFPVSLSVQAISARDDTDFCRRFQWFLLMFFGPLQLVSGVVDSFSFELISRMPRPTHFSLDLSVFVHVLSVLNSAILLGLSLYILGKRARVAAVRSLRFPKLRYALPAILFPVIITSLFPVGRWIMDRVHWAAYDFGKYDPPLFADYFDLARSWQPWLLLMIFAGFAEEIIFRGVLLRRFIERYGPNRGIFLTGIAWAVIHFRFDGYSRFSVTEVLIHLAYRVLICLAWNYVFAWMTIRWNSIIPAGLTHTVSNIFIMSGITTQEGSTGWLRILFWSVLAVLLFHFWPLTTDGETSAEAVTVDPKPSS